MQYSVAGRDATVTKEYQSDGRCFPVGTRLRVLPWDEHSSMILWIDGRHYTGANINIPEHYLTPVEERAGSSDATTKETDAERASRLDARVVRLEAELAKIKAGPTVVHARDCFVHDVANRRCNCAADSFSNDMIPTL